MVIPIRQVIQRILNAWLDPPDEDLEPPDPDDDPQGCEKCGRRRCAQDH